MFNHGPDRGIIAYLLCSTDVFFADRLSESSLHISIPFPYLTAPSVLPCCRVLSDGGDGCDVNAYVYSVMICRSFLLGLYAALVGASIVSLPWARAFSLAQMGRL